MSVIRTAFYKQTPLVEFKSIIGFVLSCFSLIVPPANTNTTHNFFVKSFRARHSESIVCVLYVLHVITHFVLLYRFWTHSNKRSVACFYGRVQAHRPFSVGLGLMKLLWSVRKAEMDTTLIAQADRGKLSFTFRSTCQYTHIWVCVPKILVQNTALSSSADLSPNIAHTHLIASSHTISPVSERNWLFHTNLD